MRRETAKTLKRQVYGAPDRVQENVVGTADYLAPELIAAAAHDERVDVYAAGVVLRCVHAGDDRPWPAAYGNFDIFAAVQRGERPSLEGVGSSATKLVGARGAATRRRGPRRGAAGPRRAGAACGRGRRCSGAAPRRARRAAGVVAPAALARRVARGAAASARVVCVFSCDFNHPLGYSCALRRHAPDASNPNLQVKGKLAYRAPTRESSELPRALDGLRGYPHLADRVRLRGGLGVAGLDQLLLHELGHAQERAPEHRGVPHEPVEEPVEFGW